ncbi:MAG TPA: TolC family protein [Vicinamibacterales bacterium]|nr:TolC family protein [Vicinamibacterales bacterium]
MSRRKALLICSALIVLAGPAAHAFAQDPVMPRIEFDAAIQQALAKNPSVANAATNIARAEALLQQARTVYRPTISAGVTNTLLDSERGFSGQVSQPQDQLTFALNGSMNVLAPARWAAVNQARDQIEVARIQTDEVRQQVAVAAAQTFLAIVAQKRQVEVSLRSLESSRAHLQYASNRLTAGAGTRLNELRATQSVSSDEARLENARMALRRAQEALGVILAADGPVDAGGEPPLDVEGALREAGVDQAPNASAWMAMRPDVKRQTLQIEAAKRVVVDSRKDWFPTGTASLDPQFITPAGLFQPSRTWRLTLSFSQPIFDGGQRRATRALRQVTVDALTLGLTSIEIRARADVRVAQAALDSAQRTLAAARRAADQANEVLRITTVVFEVGATTNIEVIDAQRSARDAETIAVQAEDQWRQARLELLVALGRFPR